MKNQKEKSAVVQVQFRCTPELQGMIVQAMGIAIYKSGKSISKNDFIIHLLQTGLKNTEWQEK